MKINILLEQIKQLQEQLKELENNTKEWCYEFENNLKIGMTGEEISKLHFALEKEGFFIDLDEKITQKFGESTAKAVSAFQNKYREEILAPFNLDHPTGYVGVNTRKKLNHLFGCKITPKITSKITPPLCEYFYWYDDQHTNCQGPKQFCGLYMYKGLKTFKTKEECEMDLKKEQICIQVITFAQDPLSGKCKRFPTPCDVPSGWKIVDTCGIERIEP